MPTKLRAKPGTTDDFGYLPSTYAVPGGAKVVSSFGNDDASYLGTENDPVASANRGAVLTGAGGTVIVTEGEYYNQTIGSGSSINLIGDGVVKFISELFPKQVFSFNVASVRNIWFEGYDQVAGSGSNCNPTACQFIDCYAGQDNNIFGVNSRFCLFDHRTAATRSYNSSINDLRNATIYHPAPLTFGGNNIAVRDCIVCTDGNLVTFSSAGAISGANFRDCVLAGSLYKFGARPNFVPTGATPEDRIQSMRNEAVAAFGGVAANYFFGCKNVVNTDAVGFTDWRNRDWTLLSTSIALYAGEAQGFAGCFDMGFSAAPNSTDLRMSTASNFNFGSDANGDYMEPTNPSMTASVETVVMNFGKLRNIKRFRAHGTESYREGRQFTFSNDLALVATPNGALVNNEWYLVRGTGITYGGVSYGEGKRFKATTANGASWSGGGVDTVVRRIIHTPKRKSQGFRFGTRGATVTNDLGIMAGWWYYVETGSITINGSTTVNEGARPFLAPVGGVYSGSYVLRAVFADSQGSNPYRPFEAAYILAVQGSVANGDFDNYNYQGAETNLIPEFWQALIVVQPDNQRFSG